MEQRYLMDSNVVIDYMGNRLPESASTFIEKLSIIISVITRIEIVGWYKASQRQIDELVKFTDHAIIFPLNENIIRQTILIRQQNKIKLPDSIIAATAMVNHVTLLTHNVADYKNVDGLQIVDSWSL